MFRFGATIMSGASAFALRSFQIFAKDSQKVKKCLFVPDLLQKVVRSRHFALSLGAHSSGSQL